MGRDSEYYDDFDGDHGYRDEDEEDKSDKDFTACSAEDCG